MAATVNDRSGWNAAVDALEEMAKAMGEKADAARSPNPFDPATMEEADAATSGWVLEQAAKLLRERMPVPTRADRAEIDRGTAEAGKAEESLAKMLWERFAGESDPAWPTAMAGVYRSLAAEILSRFGPVSLAHLQADNERLALERDEARARLAANSPIYE